MRIAHIIPGSGGSFYCGNCLRDSKYIHALKILGHDVLKVPLYLPIFEDGSDLTEIPVFYGAVNLYLKQRFPVFRHAPGFVEKLLDSQTMLHLAARKAGSTRAKGLEEMTVSMLLGEEGPQKEELDRLVNWLCDEAKPDVVHLSNALLLGLASRIREELKVPVVCSLQDEDVWVDVMSSHFREEVWDLMSRQGKHVDAFVAVSDYYAHTIRQKMVIAEEQLHTIYLGVDPVDYSVKDIQKKEPVIGYLSRMCQENGLEILIDAFILLKQDSRCSNVQLKITGGKTDDDQSFIHDQKKKIYAAGLSDFVHWVDEFEGETRQHFFDSVAVLSVPVLKGEAFGLYQLEALASGIPLVQPELGAFPEVVGLSGGGLVYSPNTPEALSEALKQIMLETEKRIAFSQKGLDGIRTHFHIQTQAEKMLDLYRQVIARFTL